MLSVAYRRPRTLASYCMYAINPYFSHYFEILSLSYIHYQGYISLSRKYVKLSFCSSNHFLYQWKRAIIAKFNHFRANIMASAFIVCSTWPVGGQISVYMQLTHIILSLSLSRQRTTNISTSAFAFTQPQVNTGVHYVSSYIICNSLIKLNQV